MSNYFDHKKILITGAASGIGKRFAEIISDRPGVHLFLWDRNPEILFENKSKMPDSENVLIRGVDVSNIDDVKKAAEELTADRNEPDIIINCAGIVVGKMFHEHTMEETQNTIQINTIGSMWVVQVFLNDMIRRGSGHIVNLASASGYIGNPRMSVYAASKWAVIGWSESLRIEMEKLKTGINVTTVIPSYIKTGMFEGVKPPIMVPLLETDQMVKLMIRGISRKKNTIEAPFMVRFVPLIKALLPDRAFSWVAGNFLGVYRSMDSFTGRNKE
ncbi:SDR family oxidoreductase [soil metagenome]